MKDPNYPTEQPKDPVADALTDRNSDPAADAQDASLKVHGDALLDSRGAGGKTSYGESSRDDQSDDGPPDGSRDEGF
ncbi:MAG: hypothetical protein HOQ16_15425 [Gemmatimonadaceae bacterium]|nr:hypothetical protein [Gemmatimonadaceae bacterium]